MRDLSLSFTRQRHDSGDVPCAFWRVGLGPSLTATAVTSGAAAVAIRCHTFFSELRQTDVCLADHFRRWRAEVRKLVRALCAPNQCEHELQVCVCELRFRITFVC